MLEERGGGGGDDDDEDDCPAFDMLQPGRRPEFKQA